MHPRMWTNPATQRNAKELERLGRVEIVGPAVGKVASGDDGPGRMVEPEQMLEAIVLAVTPKDLDGLHVIVTAGPTLEDMDPVRFLSNRSTGKMGFAVAARAAARGARTTLVAGPVQLETPPRVHRIDVRSALEMQRTMQDAGPADAIVMAAAVADYRFAQTTTEKQKKGGETATLDLLRNPDILAELGAARKNVRRCSSALRSKRERARMSSPRRAQAPRKKNATSSSRTKPASPSAVTTTRSRSSPKTATSACACREVELADALLDRIKSLLG